MRSKCCARPAAWGLLFFFLCPHAMAGSFGAGISPSKFELRAKPGQVLRDTITVLNPGEDASDYQFRTADWRLDDSRNVKFFEDELLEDSCRPWVRLERKTVRIRASGQKNYRFEVHVPENALPGLCRFAILIEPGETVTTRVGIDGEINIPIIGRYAVITYVTIGEAQANIDYLGIGQRTVNGQRLPTLKFRNRGNTYDRAFGEVTAFNSDGRRVPLIASTFPVLPGRTEEILLSPASPAPGVGAERLAYPVRLKGQIEIGGGTVSIEEAVD